MPAHVRTVEVPDADRRELERRVRDKSAPARVTERARIVLLAADEVPGKQIAAIVGCAEGTVVTWRGRYAEHGLAGLEDLPRPGKPPQLPEELRDRVLELTLTEPPDQFGATEPQGATALALQARAKFDYLRVSVLGLYRSLSYIQFDVPGFPPFQDFPEGTELNPEMFMAVGADYHFPTLHFTPGFIVGVQQPASFRSPTPVLGGNNPPESLIGTRTVVVRDVNALSILPTTCGSDNAVCEAEPIISAKATFRWDLSEHVAAIGEVYYTYDTNRTTFRDDVFGVAQPSFEEPNALGFNTLLQARF